MRYGCDEIQTFASSGWVAYLYLVRPMRRGVIIAIAVVTLGLFCIVAHFALNPLRGSESDIRKWLLKQAPLGSTRNEVLIVVKKRGWSMHPEYRGRFINGSVPTGGFGAELGTYTGLSDTNVDAYWSFSSTDHLTEVYVNKWRHNL